MNNPDDIKLSEELRESVSALIDGELGATESAFLLKRMGHDEQVHAQWQRYQCIGEALRGQASAFDADAFSAKLLAQIEEQSLQYKAPTANKRVEKRTLLRWLGGAAIAATVSWTALLMTQAETTSNPALAEAQPLTLASPAVSVHTVSGRIGSRYPTMVLEDRTALASSMDEFLLQHVQGAAVTPVSAAVYLPGAP